MVQEPVYARNTHVEHPGHVAVHNLGGHGRLGGHRQVRGASAYDQHPRDPGLLPAAVDADGPGRLVVFGVPDQLSDRLECAGVRPGHQDSVRVMENGLRNGGDLAGRLALSEHDLRKSLAKRPVVVNLRKVQVLKGQVPKLGQDLVDVQPIVLEPLQQGPQPRLVYDIASTIGLGLAA